MTHPPSLRARLLRQVVRHSVGRILNGAGTAAQRRRRLEQLGSALRLPLPRGTQVKTTALGGVPAEWLTQDDSGVRRTVLYLHGGAYIVGSPRMYRELTSRIAARWRARVAVIDYRLAPEHVYPAAQEDAFAAYRALLDSGHDPRELVIAGDSAGGGLAVATALRARDAGLPLPFALVLFSPWLDLDVNSASAHGVQDDAMLTRPGLRDAARLYLVDTPTRDPLVSPLLADLRGLPPMLIQVTDREILLDDSRRLQIAVTHAGGSAMLKLWPGLFHVWQLFAGKMPEADLALDQAGAFLDQRLTP